VTSLSSRSRCHAAGLRLQYALAGIHVGTLARAGEHLSILFVTVRLRSSGSDKPT
jgi:hypothetical protein